MFQLLHVLLFSQVGESPLYTASWEGHTGVVELLLQHNADLNISDEVSHSIMYMYLLINA